MAIFEVARSPEITVSLNYYFFDGMTTTSLQQHHYPYGRHLTLHDVAGIERVDLHHHYQQVLFVNGSDFVSRQVTPTSLQLNQTSTRKFTPQHTHIHTKKKKAFKHL